MTVHTKRIKGYDLARAIAVFIMIIVNFNMVLAQTNETGLLVDVLGILQGKGAALFVVLAGAGISLLTKNDLFTNNRVGLNQKQRLLYRRAIFLFLFGLLFSLLWPADILHFYGCYILVGALLIKRHSAYLWIFLSLMIILYPYLLNVIDYEKGWDWLTMEYSSLWSIEGFLRNFFINGFHPVLPWTAFVLAGMWLGRQNMASRYRRNIILWLSVGVFILVQMTSKTLVEVAQTYWYFLPEDAIAVFGTQPMPPMPLFMISGISGSFILIILSIWISEKIQLNHRFDFLVKTGQMAFTHYIAHIAIGIFGCYLFFGENALTTQATFLYAVTFCIASVIISHYWCKRFKRGPMSLFIRFVTRT